MVLDWGSSSVELGLLSMAAMRCAAYLIIGRNRSAWEESVKASNGATPALLWWLVMAVGHALSPRAAQRPLNAPFAMRHTVYYR